MGGYGSTATHREELRQTHARWGCYAALLDGREITRVAAVTETDAVAALRYQLAASPAWSLFRPRLQAWEAAGAVVARVDGGAR